MKLAEILQDGRYAVPGVGSHRILGEDQNGDLLVPVSWNKDWWFERYNPRNLRHWFYAWNTRRRSEVAFLDSDAFLECGQ